MGNGDKNTLVEVREECGTDLPVLNATKSLPVFFIYTENSFATNKNTTHNVIDSQYVRNIRTILK